MRVFKAQEIEEWPLTGNSPKSLSELLLQKDSQGAQSIYRLDQLDSNPLSGTIKRRKIEGVYIGAHCTYKDDIVKTTVVSLSDHL